MNLEEWILKTSFVVSVRIKQLSAKGKLHTIYINSDHNFYHKKPDPYSLCLRDGLINKKRYKRR